MIGSVGSGGVSLIPDPKTRTADQNAKAVAAGRTVADHVAEADTKEPIRSASTTQGTLVDTYL